MQRLLPLSLVVALCSLAGISSTAEEPELAVMAKRVFAEAESLGLPSLNKATLFQGMLTTPNLERNWALGARSYRHIQAKLPDGTWLVDLVQPMREEQLDQSEIKALQAFVPRIVGS